MVCVYLIRAINWVQQHKERIMAGRKGDCGGTPRNGSKGDPKPRGRGGRGRGLGRGRRTK